MKPEELQNRIIGIVAQGIPTDLTEQDQAIVIGGLIVAYGVYLHKEHDAFFVDMALKSLAEARAKLKDQ